MIERVAGPARRIGSLYAAHLAGWRTSGCSTCRPSTRAHSTEHGLTVTGRADFRGELQATADPAELPSPDVAIVATKATGLDDAAGALEGRFPDTTVVTVQNGLVRSRLSGGTATCRSSPVSPS